MNGRVASIISLCPGSFVILFLLNEILKLTSHLKSFVLMGVAFNVNSNPLFCISPILRVIDTKPVVGESGSANNSPSEIRL